MGIFFKQFNNLYHLFPLNSPRTIEISISLKRNLYLQNSIRVILIFMDVKNIGLYRHFSDYNLVNNLNFTFIIVSKEFIII